MTMDGMGRAKAVARSAGVAGLVARQRGGSPQEALAAGRRAVEVIAGGVESSVEPSA